MMNCDNIIFTLNMTILFSKFCDIGQNAVLNYTTAIKCHSSCKARLLYSFFVAIKVTRAANIIINNPHEFAIIPSELRDA